MAPCDYDFWRAPALARGASSQFCSRSTTLLWFSAPRGAGAWSVLRILFAIEFRPLAALAPGASSEFCSRSTTLSWFLVPGSAGALSVLNKIVRDRRPSRRFRPLAALAPGASSEFVRVDDPLVVFGPSRRWRLERSQNSVRDRRPSRGFRPLAPLAHDNCLS